MITNKKIWEPLHVDYGSELINSLVAGLQDINKAVIEALLDEVGKNSEEN